MVEYKVLSLAVIQTNEMKSMLNLHAAKGWRLVSATRSQMQVLLFLERPDRDKETTDV